MSARIRCTLMSFLLSFLVLLSLEYSRFAASSDGLEGSQPTLLLGCMLGATVFLATLALAFLPFSAIWQYWQYQSARIQLAASRCFAWTRWSFARWDATMDHVADKVQDAMMGWDPDNEPEDVVAKEPLPPLDPRAFGKAMRPEVVQLLDAVTREINEAPNAVSIAARGPALSKLLDAWAKRALEVGEKLRIDAAVEELPALNGPHTNWTKKFRRMKVAEGKFLPTTDD